MRGRIVTGLLMALVAACAGAATWALVVFCVPAMTGSFDGWPVISPPVLFAVAPGGLLLAFFLTRALDWAPVWSEDMPMESVPGEAAGCGGATLGALCAAALMPTPVALVIALAVTAVLGVIAAFLIRRHVREVADHRRERRRIERLHGGGTRIRAVVADLEFEHTWIADRPLFTVTAEYAPPAGPRRATGRVLTTPAGAPVVGGTVLVWFSGDGSNTEDIDIEQDPQSFRDTDAARRFEAPSSV